MCFTHDDPAADANAKLDKIAVEIDAIGKKLGRLEIWDFLGCVHEFCNTTREGGAMHML